MHVDLALIDPFDDPAVDAWWDVHADAELADRGPDAPLWTRQESRLELQQRTDTIERRAYLGRVRGTVVAAGRLALPLRDNTHIAGIGVHVLAGHRRRGIGSAVLAALEDEARGRSRSIASAQVSWPYTLGDDGSGAPGREFARRHGYALALGDVQSRLTLPADDALIDALAAEAAERSAAHTLRSWMGPVPEDVVADWAEMDAAVSTEAPIGDLELEATTASVSDVRENEALLEQQRRTSFGTIAVSGDGRAVAYTQLVVSGDDGNAYQWGTLVRTEARGHRLGMAVKIANLRMLQRHAPDVRSVYTYNAGVNAHMLAINRRLGFTPSERMGELQKKL